MYLHDRVGAARSLVALKNHYEQNPSPPSEHDYGSSMQKNLMIMAGLGGAAVFSYWAEKNSIPKEIPVPPISAAINSLAHPVLGYAAGLAVNLYERTVDKKFDATKFGAAAVASMVAFDAFAEGFQSGRNQEWYNPIAFDNLFETSKDLVFTGLGLAIYDKINSRGLINKISNSKIVSKFIKRF